jgi:hypothetical protein
MSKQVDLTNKTFGYLKVNSLKEIKYTHAFWNCTCNYCGRDTVVRGIDLHTGKFTKCLKCYGRVFNKEKALEVSKRVMNGEKKISILDI